LDYWTVSVLVKRIIRATASKPLGGVDIKGMEVLGYDSRRKVYTSRFFDNLGNSGPWRMNGASGDVQQEALP
jgi:hypothetical protein